MTRNGNPASVESLTRDLIEAATTLTNQIFDSQVSDAWASAWYAEFTRFQAQEEAARQLLSDFSRNSKSAAAHWKRVRDFLVREGVDPMDYSEERDFGKLMDLTPTARALADAYEFGSVQDPSNDFELSPNVRALKKLRAPHGDLVPTSWTGFLLRHFTTLRTVGYRDKLSGWTLEPLDGALFLPPNLFPSDLELAAISVAIFGYHLGALGVALVSPADVRDGADASTLLSEQRRRVNRARREDNARKTSAAYSQPPTDGERGVIISGHKAHLPHPRRYADHTLSSYIDYRFQQALPTEPELLPKSAAVAASSAPASVAEPEAHGTEFAEKSGQPVGVTMPRADRRAPVRR